MVRSAEGTHRVFPERTHRRGPCVICSPERTSSDSACLTLWDANAAAEGELVLTFSGREGV